MELPQTLLAFSDPFNPTWTGNEANFNAWLDAWDPFVSRCFNAVNYLIVCSLVSGQIRELD